jgi:hypothetical protein
MKRLFSLFIFFTSFTFSQEKAYTDAFQLDYLYGKIMDHSPNIIHLIQGPTNGALLSWDRQTYGKRDWEQWYNFPSFGASLLVKNMGSPELGNVYSLHGDYRFYFFKRKLAFRVGGGIAYIDNPFDIERNPTNTAYGSNISGSVLLGLQYENRSIFDSPFGFQAGTFLVHYSNGKSRSPNTSTNNYGLQLGITYDLDAATPENKTNFQETQFSEPIRFNLMMSAGNNDSGVIGMSQYPFLVTTFYADKRINRKSSLQFGAEVFLTKTVRKYIQYANLAFPENERFTGDEDWKRVGLFVGHELFIGKLSLVTQVGYYVYYPFDYLKPYYTRVGLKRYLYKGMFASIMLKTHLAKAESMEYGIGIRF